jgi:hypothetical protein
MPDWFDQFTAPAAPGAATTSGTWEFPEEEEEKPSGVGGYLTGFWNNINPIPAIKAVASMTADEWKLATEAADRKDYTAAIYHSLAGSPAGAALKIAKSAGAEQWDQLVKAREEFGKGNQGNAVGHFIAGITPLIGPASAKAGEKWAAGQKAEAAGEMTGLLADALVPIPAARAVKGAARVAGKVVNAAGLVDTPKILDRVSTGLMADAMIPSTSGANTVLTAEARKLAPDLVRREGLQAGSRGELFEKVDAHLNNARAQTAEVLTRHSADPNHFVPVKDLKNAIREQLKAINAKGASAMSARTVSGPRAAEVKALRHALEQVENFGSHVSLDELKTAYDGWTVGAAKGAKEGSSAAGWGKVRDVVEDVMSRGRPEVADALSTERLLTTAREILNVPGGAPPGILRRIPVIGQMLDMAMGGGSTYKVNVARGLAKAADNMRAGRTARAEAIIADTARKVGRGSTPAAATIDTSQFQPLDTSFLDEAGVPPPAAGPTPPPPVPHQMNVPHEFAAAGLEAPMPDATPAGFQPVLPPLPPQRPPRYAGNDFTTPPPSAPLPPQAPPGVQPNIAGPATPPGPGGPPPTAPIPPPTAAAGVPAMSLEDALRRIEAGDPQLAVPPTPDPRQQVVPPPPPPGPLLVEPSATVVPQGPLPPTAAPLGIPYASVAAQMQKRGLQGTAKWFGITPEQVQGILAEGGAARPMPMAERAPVAPQAPFDPAYVARSVRANGVEKTARLLGVSTEEVGRLMKPPRIPVEPTPPPPARMTNYTPPEDLAPPRAPAPNASPATLETVRWRRRMLEPDANGVPANDPVVVRELIRDALDKNIQPEDYASIPELQAAVTGKAVTPPPAPTPRTPRAAEPEPPPQPRVPVRAMGADEQTVRQQLVADAAAERARKAAQPKVKDPNEALAVTQPITERVNSTLGKATDRLNKMLDEGRVTTEEALPLLERLESLEGSIRERLATGSVTRGELDMFTQAAEGLNPPKRVNRELANNVAAIDVLREKLATGETLTKAQRDNLAKLVTETRAHPDLTPEQKAIVDRPIGKITILKEPRSGAAPSFTMGTKRFTPTFDNPLDRTAYVLGSKGLSDASRKQYTKYLMKELDLPKEGVAQYTQEVLRRTREEAYAAPTPGKINVSVEPALVDAIRNEYRTMPQANQLLEWFAGQNVADMTNLQIAQGIARARGEVIPTMGSRRLHQKTMQDAVQAVRDAHRIAQIKSTIGRGQALTEVIGRTDAAAEASKTAATNAKQSGARQAIIERQAQRDAIKAARREARQQMSSGMSNTPVYELDAEGLPIPPKMPKKKR